MGKREKVDRIPLESGCANGNLILFKMGNLFLEKLWVIYLDTSLWMALRLAVGVFR